MEYRTANQSLVLLAQRDLSAFWSSLNVNGSPIAVRNALLDFYPELVATYGDTAAVLGADWYDSQRDVAPSAASFRAALAEPANTDQASAAARYALGPLFTAEPDPIAALANLNGTAQRLVLQPGRDTVFDSAGRDPVRTGVARVPSGATTCRFCIMLASRGAVYYSSSSAGAVVGRGTDESVNFNEDGSQRLFGNRKALGVRARGSQEIGKKFHDNCDCVPTTIRSRDDYPEDYDLNEMRRLYAANEGIGRDIPPEG